MKLIYASRSWRVNSSALKQIFRQSGLINTVGYIKVDKWRLTVASTGVWSTCKSNNWTALVVVQHYPELVSFELILFSQLLRRFLKETLIAEGDQSVILQNLLSILFNLISNFHYFTTVPPYPGTYFFYPLICL